MRPDSTPAYQSMECRCGNRKKIDDAFCVTCYSRLSKRLAAGLWDENKTVRDDAYARAVFFLSCKRSF